MIYVYFIVIAFLICLALFAVTVMWVKVVLWIVASAILAVACICIFVSWLWNHRFLDVHTRPFAAAVEILK